MAVNYIDINDIVAAPQRPWSAPNSLTNLLTSVDSSCSIHFFQRCCVSSPCWLSRPRIGSARRWIQKDSDVVQSNELFVCGTHLILWKTPKANTNNHTNSSRAKAPFHLLSHEAKRSVSTAEVMGVPQIKSVWNSGGIYDLLLDPQVETFKSSSRSNLACWELLESKCIWTDAKQLCSLESSDLSPSALSRHSSRSLKSLSSM